VQKTSKELHDIKTIQLIENIAIDRDLNTNRYFLNNSLLYNKKSTVKIEYYKK